MNSPLLLDVPWDMPRWARRPEHHVGVNPTLRGNVPGSRMFVIKQALDSFRRHNPNIPTFDASQGDGGASLGGIPIQELSAALMKHTKNTAYGTPNGSPALREQLLERYWDLGAFLTKDHLVVCDGGRDALAKYYKAIEIITGHVGGTLITSAAPWVSYTHGSYLYGMNLLMAPQSGPMDFRLTPQTIRLCEKELNMVPSTVRAMILTTPDNPTGTHYTEKEIVNAILAAHATGVRFILVDLMYQLVTDPQVAPYDWGNIWSRLPEEVCDCVTLLDGLTKPVGASSVRMAHLVCGSKTMAEVISSIASHTVLPNILAEAAALELLETDAWRTHPWLTRIAKPTAESRTLLRNKLTQLHIPFVAEQGYYAFVDVSAYVTNDQFSTADTLCTWLAEEHGLAVVPGDAFHQPNYIRFSYALPPEKTNAALERLRTALNSL